LGGGKNEPRLLNLLPPAVFTRFAGGCSSSTPVSAAGLAAERLTTILPAPVERSSSFWNGFFDVAAAAAAAASAARSRPQSPSRSSRLGPLSRRLIKNSGGAS
jgi:hypothetical protein